MALILMKHTPQLLSQHPTGYSFPFKLDMAGNATKWISRQHFSTVTLNTKSSLNHQMDTLRQVVES